MIFRDELACRMNHQIGLQKAVIVSLIGTEV